MLASLFLATLLGTASAADCDGKALEKAVSQAAPANMAAAFVELAQCDPARAKKAATTHMKRMLAETASIPALIWALKLGESGAVVSWLDEETPDVRSRLINRLGTACNDDAAIPTFFVEQHAERAEMFWDERWHKGLDQCRVPEIQAMLAGALTSGEVARNTRNQPQYFSVLEVYARNLGAQAVPTIRALLESPVDDEEAALLVQSFADAANVGNAVDAEASKLAIEAIVSLAPKLPPRALVRARDTLSSLGSPTLADGFAKYMWPERMVDGHYTYGVAVVEDVTCKNGQQRAVLHLGAFTEDGNQWNDQLATKVDERLQEMWQPAAASKCKGTGVVRVRITEEPTLDAATLAAWQADTQREFEQTFASASKFWIVEHDTFAW